MEYVLHGFGVFLGVIAGVAISLILQWYSKRRYIGQKVKNLLFELELDTKKIDLWLAEVAKLRNAVNGDSVDAWFGYFDLSKAIFVTANDMLNTGLLYEKLSHAEVEKLQQASWELSLSWENSINEQLAKDKGAMMGTQGGTNRDAYRFAKSETVRHIDFWEGKMKRHKQSLEEIAVRLKKPK
ncbi:MAG: hypothetical protein ABIE70_10555 [bacterium]